MKKSLFNVFVAVVGIGIVAWSIKRSLDRTERRGTEGPGLRAGHHQ